MKVAIIGSGNLSWHLSHALFPHVESIYLISRKSNENRKDYPKEIIHCSFSLNWPVADIYLIAVPDHLISQIAKKSTWPSDSILLHCSGAMSLHELENPSTDHRGVFYPLQTFSREITINFSEIPLFIEYTSERTKWALKFLADCLKMNFFILSAVDRLKLHIAAVFTNNFTTVLHQLANDLILKIPQGKTEWLSPLLKETIRKTLEIGPERALTGPAKRKDYLTIQKHLDQLQNSDVASLYATFTAIILQQKPSENDISE